MKRLPQELIDYIFLLTDFETCINYKDNISNIIIKKLYDKNIHTWNWAAKNGHLNVIKWLHENISKDINYEDNLCTTWAIDWAAIYGNLDIIKFLHENRTEGCTRWAMNGAAYYGNLEIVKFLHENRTEGCTIYAMNWAAYYGHLEVVKFLHENRKEGCTEFAMEYAAKNRHQEVIKFLKKNKIGLHDPGIGLIDLATFAISICKDIALNILGIKDYV
jgi:ankyrin repeat protein